MGKSSTKSKLSLNVYFCGELTIDCGLIPFRNRDGCLKAGSGTFSGGNPLNSIGVPLICAAFLWI